MGRGALLTGTAGGIIGIIAAVMGFIWIIVTTSTTEPIIINIPIPMVSSYVLTVPIYTGLSMVQIVLAILFVSLLLVSCILTGIGFYGMYTVSQSAMGIVGLAFGIIGGVSTTIIILIGLFTNPSISFQSYVLNSLYWNWLAFIILGVSFILMGSASIVLREYTMRSTAAYAAGILSIIGGIAFILYILLLTFFVGLALVFVAFLLWAIIFYSTEA